MIPSSTIPSSTVSTGTVSANTATSSEVTAARSNFFSEHFSSRIAQAVEQVGYTDPTEIQSLAIPVVLQGKDVLGLAQTGTGKTAAFVLPILERLDAGKKDPSALIVAPTRELAEQILQAIRSFTVGSRVRSVSLYGGVSMHGQIQALRGGVDIIVACPGRLMDHVQRRTVDLGKIKCAVLDEADHMFDMGFLPVIRKIINALPRERQTLLFSATMPKEVRQLALDILREPEVIEVNHTAPKSSVSHAVYSVPPHLKSALTLEILNSISTGSVLIFCRTKRGVKKLVEQLCKAGQKATSLRGNLSQGARRDAINGFRGGAYRIMVATDIAARGIDISSISHVLNYDIPDTVEAYTHRIGRTGRASRIGDAFTLVSRQDERMVRNIERMLGAKIDRRVIEAFDYKAEKIDLPVVKEWNGQEEAEDGSSQGGRSRRRSSEGGDRPRGRKPFGSGRFGGKRYGERSEGRYAGSSRGNFRSRKMPYNVDGSDSFGNEGEAKPARERYAADSRDRADRSERSSDAPRERSSYRQRDNRDRGSRDNRDNRGNRENRYEGRDGRSERGQGRFSRDGGSNRYGSKSFGERRQQRDRTWSSDESRPQSAEGRPEGRRGGWSNDRSRGPGGESARSNRFSQSDRPERRGFRGSRDSNSTDSRRDDRKRSFQPGEGSSESGSRGGYRGGRPSSGGRPFKKRFNGGSRGPSSRGGSSSTRRRED